jgi:hypothetical protein
MLMKRKIGKFGLFRALVPGWCQGGARVRKAEIAGVSGQLDVFKNRNRELYREQRFEKCKRRQTLARRRFKSNFSLR